MGGATAVGLLTAHCEAWSVGHEVKIRTLTGRCAGCVGMLRLRSRSSRRDRPPGLQVGAGGRDEMCHFRRFIAEARQCDD